MSYLVLREFDPLVVVHRHAPAYPLGTATMLATVDRLLSEAIDRHRRLALIYDAANIDPIGGSTRRLLGEWLRDPHGLLARGATSLDLVHRSPLTRGVLEAVLWLRKPPVRGLVHERREQAVESALASLRQAGLEPPPRLASGGDAVLAARIRELLARPGTE